MNAISELFQDYFKGKIELVKRRLDRLLSRRKDDPMLWFLKALIETRQESYEDALKAVEEAIKLRKEFYEAWILRGSILRSLKLFREAIASFDEAIKIRLMEEDYDDYEVKVEKARTYIVMGDKIRAREIIIEILEINPEDDDVKALLNEIK